MTETFPDLSVPMKLVGQKQSLNAQRVALTLALTGTPFEYEVVDLAHGAHKDAAYEALNPFGRVPTLVHGDLVLRQSATAMRYVALRADSPLGPAGTRECFEIENWFGFTVDYMSAGLARLRFINRFQGGEPAWLKDYFRPNMHRGLDILQRRLSVHDWLALGRPTLAECSLHPFVSVWPEAEVDIAAWPAVAAWLERVKELPGWQEPEAMLAAMGG